MSYTKEFIEAHMKDILMFGSAGAAFVSIFIFPTPYSFLSLGGLFGIYYFYYSKD